MGANFIPPLHYSEISHVSSTRVLKASANKVIIKNELIYDANINTIFRNSNIKVLNYVIFILVPYSTIHPVLP